MAEKQQLIPSLKSPTILAPKYTLKMLHVWNSLFLRTTSSKDKSKDVIMDKAYELRFRVEQLEVRLAELEEENKVLKESSNPGDTINTTPSTSRQNLFLPRKRLETNAWVHEEIHEDDEEEPLSTEPGTVAEEED